jgi:predicted GNAT superfamily acetyltransferase
MPTDTEAIEIRPLATLEDYAACVDLQRDTWGREFGELVPPALLQVTQKVGGIAAGAFEPDGRLVGFVYGITGVKDGSPVHWSHMLAVRQDSEGLGLGRLLKAYQREELVESGVRVSYWTFDPLVARNAHFNLNRLGVSIIRYVPNMYGDTGSELHSGLGTDRFLVEWQHTSEQVAYALLHGRPPDLPDSARAPVVASEHPGAVDGVYPAEPVVKVAVPWDIQQVKAESFDVGMHWRHTTRRAFDWYLGRGYEVRGFEHDASDRTGCYVLVRSEGS